MRREQGEQVRQLALKPLSGPVELNAIAVVLAGLRVLVEKFSARPDVHLQALSLVGVSINHLV